MYYTSHRGAVRLVQIQGVAPSKGSSDSQGHSPNIQLWHCLIDLNLLLSLEEGREPFCIRLVIAAEHTSVRKGSNG